MFISIFRLLEQLYTVEPLFYDFIGTTSDWVWNWRKYKIWVMNFCR